MEAASSAHAGAGSQLQLAPQSLCTRERLHALLSASRIDVPAVRAAIADGALLAPLDDARGPAGSECEGKGVGGGREAEEYNKMRGMCWKLLVGALSADQRSWAFYSRQQREWYSDLSAAAAAVCKASQSPAWTCSSLRFTLHSCGLDERTKAEVFAVVARLLQTLELKELVSCSEQSSSGGACDSDNECIDLCIPLTARALPSAELESLAWESGQRRQQTDEERHERQAESFDMASIAAIIVLAMRTPGGEEHEAFWCLHRFAVLHAVTGAVFGLVHLLQSHLAMHDPELLCHLHDLGLSVGDVSRAWFRNLFAGTLAVKDVLTLWDLLLCFGTDFAIAVAAALLQGLRARLLQLGPGAEARGRVLEMTCCAGRHLPSSHHLVSAALEMWQQHIRAASVATRSLLPPPSHYLGQLRQMVTAALRVLTSPATTSTVEGGHQGVVASSRRDCNTLEHWDAGMSSAAAGLGTHLMRGSTHLMRIDSILNGLAPQRAAACFLPSLVEGGKVQGCAPSVCTSAALCVAEAPNAQGTLETQPPRPPKDREREADFARDGELQGGGMDTAAHDIANVPNVPNASTWAVPDAAGRSSLGGMEWKGMGGMESNRSGGMQCKVLQQLGLRVYVMYHVDQVPGGRSTDYVVLHAHVNLPCGAVLVVSQSVVHPLAPPSQTLMRTRAAQGIMKRGYLPLRAWMFVAKHVSPLCGAQGLAKAHTCSEGTPKQSIAHRSIPPLVPRAGRSGRGAAQTMSRDALATREMHSKNWGMGKSSRHLLPSSSRLLHPSSLLGPASLARDNSLRFGGYTMGLGGGSWTAAQLVSSPLSSPLSPHQPPPPEQQQASADLEHWFKAWQHVALTLDMCVAHL
jgi:hypothetical protein